MAKCDETLFPSLPNVNGYWCRVWVIGVACAERRSISTTIRFCLSSTIAFPLLITREVDRARKAIEKRHLKQHGMKKVGDREYKLIMSYEGEDDLDERIYALLSMIMREARGRKCNIKVNVREKGTDRYW